MWAGARSVFPPDTGRAPPILGRYAGSPLDKIYEASAAAHGARLHNQTREPGAGRH